MKQQFNFYMDSRVKMMLPFIKKMSPEALDILSDSQLVEKLICDKFNSLSPMYTVKSKGLCDDPYCPACSYMLDDDLFIGICPMCGSRLDWTPWKNVKGLDS